MKRLNWLFRILIGLSASLFSCKMVKSPNFVGQYVDWDHPQSSIQLLTDSSFIFIQYNSYFDTKKGSEIFLSRFIKTGLWTAKGNKITLHYLDKNKEPEYLTFENYECGILNDLSFCSLEVLDSYFKKVDCDSIICCNNPSVVVTKDSTYWHLPLKGKSYTLYPRGYNKMDISIDSTMCPYISISFINTLKSNECLPHKFKFYKKQLYFGSLVYYRYKPCYNCSYDNSYLFWKIEEDIRTIKAEQSQEFFHQLRGE